MKKQRIKIILLFIFIFTGLFSFFHNLPLYYGDEFKVVDRSFTIFKNGESIIYTKKTVYLKPSAKQIRKQLSFRKKSEYSCMRWEIMLKNVNKIKPKYKIILLNIPIENSFVWEKEDIKNPLEEDKYFVLLENYKNKYLQKFNNYVKNNYKRVKTFYNKLNKKKIIIYEK